MNKPDWAERMQRTREREYDKGVEAERERIIAILKEELKDSLEPIQGTKGGWREHLIARIKGENK